MWPSTRKGLEDTETECCHPPGPGAVRSLPGSWCDCHTLARRHHCFHVILAVPQNENLKMYLLPVKMCGYKRWRQTWLGQELWMLIFYLCQGTLTLLCHPCSEGPLGTGPSQVCMVAGSTRFGNKKSSATACSVHPGCRSQTENLCVTILKRRSPLTRRLCSRKLIYFS